MGDIKTTYFAPFKPVYYSKEQPGTMDSNSIYAVKKGDSLSKIIMSRTENLSKKQIEELTNKVYEDNKTKQFMNGNIHSIYAGQKLDLSSVKDSLTKIPTEPAVPANETAGTAKTAKSGSVAPAKKGKPPIEEEEVVTLASEEEGATQEVVVDSTNSNLRKVIVKNAKNEIVQESSVNATTIATESITKFKNGIKTEEVIYWSHKKGIKHNPEYIKKYDAKGNITTELEYTDDVEHTLVKTTDYKYDKDGTPTQKIEKGTDVADGMKEYTIDPTTKGWVEKSAAAAKPAAGTTPASNDTKVAKPAVTKKDAQIIAETDRQAKPYIDIVNARIDATKNKVDGDRTTYYDKDGKEIKTISTGSAGYKEEYYYDRDKDGRIVNNVYRVENSYYYDGDNEVKVPKAVHIISTKYNEDGTSTTTVKSNNPILKRLTRIVDNALNAVYGEWMSDTDIANNQILQKVAADNNIKDIDNIPDFTPITLPGNKDYYGLQTGQVKKANFAEMTTTPEGFKDPTKIEMTTGTTISGIIYQNYGTFSAYTNTMMSNIIKKANYISDDKRFNPSRTIFLPDPVWAKQKIAEFEAYAAKWEKFEADSKAYQKKGWGGKIWTRIKGDLPTKPLTAEQEAKAKEKAAKATSNNYSLHYGGL